MPAKSKNLHDKLKRKDYTWNKIKNRLLWACNNTNLHGFKFVTIKDASTSTRWFFACISCLSLILCSYLIILQLDQNKDQFIVSRIISTSYPVWKYRFPAVTICNFNVVYKKSIKNLKNLVTSHGVREEIFMDFVQNLSALIEFDEKLLGDVDHYKEVYDVLEKNGYTVDRTMEELAQPCESMVKKCFWRASEVSCNQIIQKIKTNYGYCCTFNYYGKRKVAEGIIDPNNDNYTYMGLIGSNYGLSLVLNVERDQYMSPITPTYGLNVLVKNGADYPDMLLARNTLRNGEKLSISTKSNIYVSSENLRDIDLKKRQCLFENEGNRTWSSRYSYSTCLTQWKAEAIYELCGCIPFYYSIENKYTTLHTPEDFVSDEEDNEEEEKEDHIHCQCYPQCNEQTLSVHAKREKVTSVVGFENKNLSILNVYDHGNNCVKTKKEVHYTWYRILSVLGGIFSLCLGGSILSVVECVYIFGKCLYKFNDLELEKERMPESSRITRINIKAIHGTKMRFKKKAIVVSKVQMFLKAFGQK